MQRKLKEYFDNMVVYKDLSKSNFFASLNLPSFMRDWLLKRFEREDGTFDQDQILSFVRQYLPKPSEWTALKSRIVFDRERVKILGKISADINLKTEEAFFTMPDFKLREKDTVIPRHVWSEWKHSLSSEWETWGMITLGYEAPDSEIWQESTSRRGSRKPGRIRLEDFRPFQPYTVDLEYYKAARAQFTIDEWIDLLLGAIDYNAAGYGDNQEHKLTMLTRLLPFVEKRLNLIELAPKGTGKSYVFGNVSRHGWLSSGGRITRAKMFYDLQKKQEGLVAAHDFVALDEVQTVSFADVDEMRAALKGYMENNGQFTVGKHSGTADAGIILCGNISKETMDADGFANMFVELPAVFHESALIERFHGFIKGWNIPRMNEDLKVAGWALNSEYFCSIMHELRSDSTYRHIVDEIVKVPKGSDTRDTEAVKRIATAYLKLLFPQVQTYADVDEREFRRYCLGRACEMRDIIRYQLGLLDSEYAGTSVPTYEVSVPLD